MSADQILIAYWIIREGFLTIRLWYLHLELLKEYYISVVSAVGLRDTTHSTHPCWVRERPYPTHTSALTSLVCAALFSNPMCWMLLKVQYSLYLSLSYHIKPSWYQRWKLHLVIKPRSRSALIYILSWQRVHSNHYNISTQRRWPNID